MNFLYHGEGMVFEGEEVENKVLKPEHTPSHNKILCRKEKKWSELELAGFCDLVELAERAGAVGVSRHELRAASSTVPRLLESLAVALDKYLLVEVGIGRQNCRQTNFLKSCWWSGHHIIGKFSWDVVALC
jgi:hypothetical protein